MTIPEAASGRFFVCTSHVSEEASMLYVVDCDVKFRLTRQLCKRHKYLISCLEVVANFLLDA